MPPANTPLVDLIVVFRSSEPHPSSSLAKISAYATKQLVAENAQAAEAEYKGLLSTLRESGLHATGRRGGKNGQVLVLVWAPWETLRRMIVKERQSDFLRGLPASSLPSLTTPLNPEDIAPADRLRLIYERITSTPHDGGLGIVPGGKGWERVESVMALHDREFNDMWLRAWTRRQIGLGIGIGELDKIKDQFGESIALYFSFLSSYAYSLIYISALGVLFYLLKLPYSAIYSTALVIWSVGFVEFWRLRERALAIRWGTLGSFRVEHRRAQYEDSVAPGGSAMMPWWKRDLRMLASLPVILVFATVLALLLTGIFVFEAFVTTLYTGPGQKYVSFSPTILFMSLVPRILAIYQSYAARLTTWENHAHQSTHDASLTIKTFVLSAIVAYLGLALSAFVYVPFGDTFMETVQKALSVGSATVGARFATYTNGTVTSEKANGLWANQKLGTNPTRLQDQMFAYTVTNQGIGTFLEVGLPFIMRKVNAFRNGSSHTGKNPSSTSDSSLSSNGGGGKKKRVVFEDEESGEKEEREFLSRVRHEVALPEYTLFSDYAEMVTQFGYVALWSTIWPLAPVMALLNNWLELRSDALKITSHCRRPIPMRTDTVGPWLDALGVITWLAALTNSALVYLFHPTPSPSESFAGTSIIPPSAHHHTHTLMPASSASSTSSYAQLIAPALLIALSSSHAYFIVRRVIRHILERVLWRGGKEEAMEEEANVKMKQRYLKSLGVEGFEGESEKGTAKGKGKEKEVVVVAKDALNLDGLDATGFWSRDEGLDEILKVVKDS